LHLGRWRWVIDPSSPPFPSVLPERLPRTFYLFVRLSVLFLLGAVTGCHMVLLFISVPSRG